MKASLKTQLVIVLVLVGILPVAIVGAMLVGSPHITGAASITLASTDINLGLIVFAFVAAILAFALVYSRSVTKPIMRLTEKVEGITKGKFDVKLDDSRMFEVQNLTNSLNRILASMKLAILRAGVSKEDLGIGEAIKAKEEAEKRFRSLFESAPDLIYILNKDGGIIQANVAVEEVLGLSAKELTGRKFDDFLTGTSKKSFKKLFPTLLKKDVARNELEIMGKKRPIPVDSSYSVIRSGKDISFIVLFQHDISNRKKSEKDLYKSSQDQQEIAQSLRDELLKRKIAEQQREQYIAQLQERTAEFEVMASKLKKLEGQSKDKET